MDNREMCVSVFKNGNLTKEEYTAVWVALIDRLSRSGRASVPEGKRT